MKYVLLSLLISSVSTAQEWLYPVAPLDDGTILLIHQKEPTHIDLFSWDPHTKKATKAAPLCMPSRSHSARVTVVSGVSGIDYRYASCTDTALFYITRHVEDRAVPAARCQKHAHCRCRPLDPVDAFLYSINSIPLSELEVVGHETLQEAVRRSSVRETPLIAPQERPLVFLKMISDKEGFVLEHAQLIEKDVNTITLKCHHLYKDTPHSWSLSYLFSYTIPSYLVFPQSSDRLYEGFLPFIPWYDSTAVYFVDYKGSDAGIYGYSLKTHEVIPVVKPVHNSLYCAPILIGKNLIYGDNSPQMEYRDGQLHIEMPGISVKI